MVNNFAFSPRKLVSVIGLHSSAINLNDITNQLLNLWTIVEVLVPTEPKNSFSKINQICNTITTVLNSQYIYSLIIQLLADLRNCIPDVIESKLADICEGNSDLEKIVAILVVLPKYHTDYSCIFTQLVSFPLLQYPIQQYSTLFSHRN